MTFEDMWKSLEEKDTIGKYKQAREMADLNVEQLEYAYNSGYADAKSKYELPQGKWIFYKDFNESCRYGCNQCGNLTNIPSNFCPNCGVRMQKGD